MHVKNQNARRFKRDYFIIARMIIIFIIGFTLIPYLQAYSNSNRNNERDNMEEQIWAQELKYFTSLYSADYEEVLVLTHEQFLGWPGTVKHPIDKDGSARFMKQLITKPIKCTIKIEREGIKILGNVALTQYIIHVNFENASGGKVTQSRITHTWVKEKNQWKLIGGMSYDQ